MSECKRCKELLVLIEECLDKGEYEKALAASVELYELLDTYTWSC